MKLYNIHLDEALIENYDEYTSFNDFFTRKLKPSSRPIVTGDENIASPVDGIVAQVGVVKKNILIQAKSFQFNLDSLFGNDLSLSQIFKNGTFATLYLAPHHYHRVHMPLDGTLIKTIYIPGRLFSVNQTTTQYVPNLYSRNERLICVFSTKIGKVAILFIGAMIVGSIQTQWLNQPIRSKKIQIRDFKDGPFIKKGEELGYFKLGSTIILLFQENKIRLINDLKEGSSIKIGQLFAKISD